MVSGFRDTTTQITHSMTVVFQTWMCYILALSSLRVYSPQLAAFFGVCQVPRDYVDIRSRRLLESRRFLHDLILALRRP